MGILTGDESVTFTCLAEGEGLSYSWERLGSQSPLSVTTHTLVISGVREEDSGNYRCTVRNQFGRVLSDFVFLNVSSKKLRASKPIQSLYIDIHIDRQIDRDTLMYTNTQNPNTTNVWY